MLSEESVRQHVDSLADHAAKMVLADAVHDRLWLQGAAHKMISQAGAFGLTRLCSRAKALEEACKTDTRVSEALKAFSAAASDISEFLAPRL